MRRFRNRRHAGQILATKLGAYAGRDDVLVLALPRGGVPVAFEVARALHAPLDAFTVRKLGVPGQEEYAFGAIATGGVRVFDRRGDRPLQAVAGKTVVVVDDGLATGASMRAAVQALRALGPARIVVAVPTGARQSCDGLRPLVDALVCVSMPEPFYAVGGDYDNFRPTSDEEVCRLLAIAAGDQAAVSA